MQFTDSDANVVHEPTGHTLHQSNLPVPTAVSPQDLNMVIWSLMKIVLAAGLPGAPFDPDDIDSYSVLEKALQQIYRPRDKALVTDHGAKGDGTHNDLPALLVAKAYSSRLHFPAVNNLPTTYYIGVFAAGQLDNISISADKGVTLSFAANAPYSLYKAISFESDIQLYFRDIQRLYTVAATPTRYKKVAPSIPPTAQRRNRLALDCSDAKVVNCRQVDWPAADAFTAAAVTATTRELTFGAGTSALRGAFVELGCYETVSAFFDNGIAPGPIGVVIRGVFGYTVLLSNGLTGNYTTGTKPIGGAAVGPSNNLQWPQLGQGDYSSFAPDRSVWSVSKVASDRAVVKINGKAVTAPFASGVGDIFEVGFVCLSAGAFVVSALTVERRTDACLGMQMLEEIRIFGDSTAETLPTSWDQYLRPLLDGIYGVRVGSVANYAVAGQTLDEQYATMQSVGLGNAYYVCVCAGTNNVQSLQALADWKLLVSDVADFIISNGRKPLFVVPWMWYGQAQAGGSGQPATNYDKAAPYRLWLERVAFEKGAVLVKMTEELPNPSPTLLTQEPGAPLLRDNIHQDGLAHQLYSQAVAKAIIDDYCALPGSVEEAVAAALQLNGASADTDFRMYYDKSGLAGLAGTLSVTTIADGTALLRLPRYMAPRRALNMPVVALSAGLAVLGSCWVLVDPVTSTVKLQKAPAGATKLIFAGPSWQSGASAV